MNSHGFSCSVLMCHAPIAIPQVANGRAELCASTTRAMREAAQTLVTSRVESVVVLSPHTPRYRSAFGVVEGTEVWGDFHSFGRPDISVKFSSDRGVQDEIASAAHRHGIEMRPVPSGPLDHGAMVPLHFLREAGFQGQVLVIGFPYESMTSRNQLMGQALQELVASRPERWGLLASGDMSHRLTPGAPAGFHPQAARFDRLVVKCVDSGEYRQVCQIDPELRECAAEDVVDSLEIAATALGPSTEGRRVLSYEGPFGVGYLVAILKNEGSQETKPRPSSDTEEKP